MELNSEWWEGSHGVLTWKHCNYNLGSVTNVRRTIFSIVVGKIIQEWVIFCLETELIFLGHVSLAWVFPSLTQSSSELRLRNRGSAHPFLDFFIPQDGKSLTFLAKQSSVITGERSVGLPVHRWSSLPACGSTEAPASRYYGQKGDSN